MAVSLALSLGSAQAQRLADPEYGPAKWDIDNETCLKCHSDKKLVPETERGRSLNLFVEKKEFIGTFHENLACVDCHQGAKRFDKPPHNDGKPLQLACAFCHDKTTAEYKASVHGQFRAKGDQRIEGDDESSSVLIRCLPRFVGVLWV